MVDGGGGLDSPGEKGSPSPELNRHASKTANVMGTTPAPRIV